MKVLHVIPSIEHKFGGPSASLCGLLSGMAALDPRRIEVELFAKRGLSEPPIDPPVARVDAGYLFDRFWIPTWSCVRELGAAVDRADLVHVHSYFSRITSLALDLAIARNRPLVLTPRGCLHVDAIGHASSHLKRAFLALKGRKQLGAVRAFHYQSEAEAAGSITGRRAARPLIRIIDNGVAIPASRASLAGIRARLFDEPEGLNLVFLGRLHKIKGLSLQLEALAALVRQGRAAKLHLVGPDDGHLRDILDLAASLGVADHVAVHGAMFGQEKFDWMRAADAVLMSSEFENNSNVALEVLACGGVLIATRNCVDESLGREGAALVTDRDAGHLAAAIMKIASDQALALAIREKAASIADQRYSWTSRAAEMVDFYGACLNA